MSTEEKVNEVKNDIPPIEVPVKENEHHSENGIVATNQLKTTDKDVEEEDQKFEDAVEDNSKVVTQPTPAPRGRPRGSGAARGRRA